jgi:hypothetical protein
MAERGSSVVQFLEGTGPEGRGEMISTILSLSDGELEGRHDYIQWLFPLTEPSRAVPGSPVLTASDVASIRSSEPARRNLIAAASRMQEFYARDRHWLCEYDHNHLRITRIIASLRLLHGDEAADSFRKAVLGYAALAGNPINASSLDFWADA